MRSKHLKWCWVGMLVSLLVLPTTRFFATQATKTLDRQFDAVVLRGSVFAPDLIDAPIAELFLYAYRGDTDSWEQIPWQIDEIDTSGFFGIKDGQFDGNDQLVFMAKDAGDKAGEMNWIDNAEALAHSRFELEIVDPLDTAKRAWVYLYRSETLIVDPTLADYMTYTPPQREDWLNDIIDGTTYRQGHTAATGIINHYSILGAAGGDTTDMIDQQKARIIATTTLGTIRITEENSLKPDTLQVLDGPVRIVREVIYDIVLPGSDIEIISDVPLPIVFYPYYNGVGGKGIEIPTDLPLGAKLKMFRTSVDFDEKSKGMMFYNDFNTAVPIDEMADAINDTLIEDTLNWVLITGAPGSVVFLIDVSEVGTSQLLYYDDSGAANPTEADGTEKTGDGRSIGDTGLIIRGDDLAGETLNLGFTAIFLPPNQDPAIGPQLAEQFANPLRVNLTNQIFDATPPAAIADLTVTEVGNDFAVLSWTAPGDDGTAGGSAAAYEIRYSTTEVGTDLQAWWDAATPVTNVPTPGDPGTTETLTVANLNTAQTHFFVARSVDDVGNTSDFSNVATALPVPVELVSFTHSVERNLVRLAWSIAKETNNLGFEIERRRPQGRWERIGFVSGSGSTSDGKAYSYLDAGLKPGVYEYRLKQVDANGRFEILATVRVEVLVPDRFALDQNFPNPFNPSTTIRYQVGKEAQGSLTQIAVFDLLGREVRRLVDTRLEPGYYEVTWDGRDGQGRRLPSGIYFVRLRSGKVSLVKRMLLSQ